MRENSGVFIFPVHQCRLSREPCHNHDSNSFNLMRKALWLELPKFQPPRTTTSPVDELSHYRRLRSPAHQTPRRAEEESIYRSRLQEWFRLPENRWCRVYLRLQQRRVPATQCHHYQGRRGLLLLHEPFWIPVSWEGHRWIDDHREQARALGLLCPLGWYNSPVLVTSAETGPSR